MHKRTTVREHGREETEEASYKVSYKQVLKDGQNFDDNGGKCMPSRGDRNKGKEMRKALSEECVWRRASNLECLRHRDKLERQTGQIRKGSKCQHKFGFYHEYGGMIPSRA